MELNFDFDAEMPKSTRMGGSGRVGTPWEDHLSPLRQAVNQRCQVFTFEDNLKEDGTLVTAHSQAQSRVTVISNRLRSKVPMELWKFQIRNTTPTTCGVWITYGGIMNEHEYKSYLARREERGNKIRAGREAKKQQESKPVETGSAGSMDDIPTLPAQSPAERVANARKKNAQKVAS